MKNIPQNEFENQVASLVTGFIKEKLETVMKEEIKNYLRIEHPQEGNSKNGYYQKEI
jgi:putative transposase